MRKLTHQEIVGRQELKKGRQRLPLTVVLNNVRSLYNVGSIFRTADGAGIEKIWLCGITGFPPNNQIAKTALGAQESVPWDYRKDAGSVIKELKEKNYQIVLLEQAENSCLLEVFKPEERVCLVLGNEIEGVSSCIVSQCDQAVEIEMDGVKNSLNVSVAFGIAAYHIRKCLKF